MNTVQQQPWLQFKRPFVRDLAFALACPDILKQWVSPDLSLVSPKISVHESGFWQRQYANYIHRLNELDTTNAYQELTRYLMSRPSPYRLGFHFEGLMHFWLEDGFKLGLHPYEVVAHNVQLFNGLQTTGELDFILHNQDTGDIEHWELAIKFYLGSAPYNFVNWVGINSRDNLERKLIHMQTKPFRSLWVDLDCYDKVKIDKRYVVMKGRFFQPIEAQGTRPDWLNDTFPMHLWHEIKDNESFENLEIPDLRPAHYIEWFTPRPFYDAHFLTKNSSKKSKTPLNKEQERLQRKKHQQWPYVPLKYEDLDTNLYINNGEPMVLVVNKHNL